jgi:hypothetical protein
VTIGAEELQRAPDNSEFAICGISVLYIKPARFRAGVGTFLGTLTLHDVGEG